MNKGLKKYRIKRVSLSRYVLQEWSVWFPFWIQVDLTGYQLLNDDTLRMVGSQTQTSIRHHRIISFIIAFILLFIIGCRVPNHSSTSYNKASEYTFTGKYITSVQGNLKIYR